MIRARKFESIRIVINSLRDTFNIPRDITMQFVCYEWMKNHIKKIAQLINANIKMQPWYHNNSHVSFASRIFVRIFTSLKYIQRQLSWNICLFFFYYRKQYLSFVDVSHNNTFVIVVSIQCKMAKFLLKKGWWTMKII